MKEALLCALEEAGMTLDDLFDQYDENKNDFIDMPECVNIFLGFGCSPQDSAINDPKLGAELDRDGDGNISRKEFARIKGDPHLVTWNGEKGDFHGECDLVLMSGLLEDETVLNVHVRTKIVTDWSYITTAAIQIGSDILELHTNEQHSLNGVAGAQVTTLGGYPVYHKPPFFTIDLGSGQELEFRNRKMISVNANKPRAETFGNVVGLFGDFATGLKLARDGVTNLEDWNDFGKEWQVLETEPKLFSTIEGPQLPRETCKMPNPFVATAERKRRRLRGITREVAEKVCAILMDPSDFEFCVADVLVSGDLDMASAY